MIKIGNLEIDNLILWGETADFIMNSMLEYQQLQTRLRILQAGVSPDLVKEVAPLLEQAQNKQKEIQDIKAKVEKTQADVDRVDLLIKEINQLEARMLTVAPELTGRITQGLSDEQRNEVKTINEQLVKARDSLLKEICGNVEPKIDYEQVKKLSKLYKEELIYQVCKEPQNLLDGNPFVTEMERMNPHLGLSSFSPLSSE